MQVESKHFRQLLGMIAIWSLTCGHLFALEPTTFFVVRHAEKAGSSGDVPLSAQGQKRAELLRDIAVGLRAKAVYATAAMRAQQTAQPSATALAQSIHTYNQIDHTWASNLKTMHAGQGVLIVGHSDTVPMIVTLLGGTGHFDIDDEYDNLFIVTVNNDGASILHLKYGN